MICFPNAKINLGLRVTGKRIDGYHNIETIFYPIPVSDALEIVTSNTDDDYRLNISGEMPQTETENNLVTKAYRLLKSDYSLKPVDVYLLKAIPSGAGLGGGSSDAAFMIKLLNDFNKLDISEEKMELLSSQIGSDCPFFIRNKPQLAKGTGNIFSSTSVSLKGFYMILIKPDIHVSTAEAYSLVKPSNPENSLEFLIKEPVWKWKDLIVNDFENGVFEKHPEIAEIKKIMYSNGALFSLMTGSGSAVYGLFEKKIDLKEYFKDYYYWSSYLS